LPVVGILIPCGKKNKTASLKLGYGTLSTLQRSLTEKEGQAISAELCWLQVVFDNIYVCSLEFVYCVFFSPGHYGLPVTLKVSFREADIQSLYPNEWLSSFLNIRKMLLKRLTLQK